MTPDLPERHPGDHTGHTGQPGLTGQPDHTVRVVRVVLPAFLRTLGQVVPGPTVSATGEISLTVSGDVTTERVLDALEARYPTLRGTVRDRATSARRPFIRFFACEEDLSHEPPDAPLPETVANGREPFVVLGAIAGG